MSDYSRRRKQQKEDEFASVRDLKIGRKAKKRQSKLQPDTIESAKSKILGKMGVKNEPLKKKKFVARTAPFTRGERAHIHMKHAGTLSESKTDRWLDDPSRRMQMNEHLEDYKPSPERRRRRKR